MFNASLLASVFATLLSAQTSNGLTEWMASKKPPQDPAWALQVTTPTYGTDGKITGASATYKPLVIGQPLQIYPHSGKSLCESSSPTRDLPPDAGNGWRLQVVPMSHSGGVLMLQVDWERMWERGAKVSGPRGKALAALRLGDRIVFDYISVGERALSPNMATEARAVTGQGCDAIGMGLEIGLEPVERTELIEANLWLVRKLPDGTEQSQRQVIRARAGSTVEYFFEDVTMSGAPIVAPGTTPAGATREFFFFNMPVRTLGKLSLIEVVDGAVKLTLFIEQYLAGPSTTPPPGVRITGGSTTFPITARPNEVLSFQVPKITDDRLSLRIQVKRIR